MSDSKFTSTAPPKQLHVASWPGAAAGHNAFVPVFLQSLETAGARVTGIERAEDFPPVGAGWPDGTPDILLLHWAERVFGESKTRWQALAKMRCILGALSRRHSNTKAVWLVHNLAPHDARPLQRLVWGPYTRAIARHVDGFLTLSPGTVGVVRNAFPGVLGKPAAGLWHPVYPDAALNAAERTSARASFGFATHDRVLGYCGQIRPYKGVEELVRAFRSGSDPTLKLLIAGRPAGPALAEWLARQAAEDERIALQLENLHTAAFRAALGACDVIVAPLRDYLHSGSIVHALSAERPVLTPTAPFAESLAGLLGREWVRTYGGALTPDLLAAQGLAVGAPDLSALAPERVGRAAMAFFRGLWD